MYIPNFTPTVEEDYVRKAIQQYEKTPDEFNEENLDMLDKHASHYNIPFARQSLDSSIGSIVSQVGSGFLSGFTTFNLGEQPKNEWEAIARNIGHLAGFVGYIPSLPLKIVGATKLAAAAQALRGKSVPMVAATAVTKKTKEVLKLAGKSRAGATAASVGFLQNKKVLDVIEGGFHLGIASAVGSWQGGVDEMMDSFIHGAETGAVFRTIGNVINKDMMGFGKKLEPSQLGPGGRPKWKALSGGQKGDTAIKMMASSMYTGIPSTMRGETTPEQIYNYLLGAYFGFGEMPQETRMAGAYLTKMRKAAQKDPEMNISRDPELLPEWDTLTSREQDLVRRASIKAFGFQSERDALIYAAAEKAGVPVEEIAKQVAEFEKVHKTRYNKYGEAIYQDHGQKVEGKESTDISGTDIGEDAGPRDPVTLKAVNFVEKNLEDSFKKIKDPAMREKEKLDTSLAIETKWSELTHGKKKNPSLEMVDWIEKEYKVGLNTEARDFFRQWGEQRIKKKPVQLAGLYQVWNPETKRYDTETRMLNHDLSDKTLAEPLKPIDDAWLIASERVLGEKSREKPYFIFDHFVKGSTEFKGFDAWEREMMNSAKDYAKKLQYSKATYDKDGNILESGEEWLQRNYGATDWRFIYKDIARQWMKETEQQMWKQANELGYYYFGGRGDAERRYYVKYHPNTPQSEDLMMKAFHQIQETISRKSGKSLDDIHEELGADMNQFVSERRGKVDRDGVSISRKDGSQYFLAEVTKAELEADYVKGFVSNVLWEAELNYGGIKNLKDGIGKLELLTGDGYINTAKNFNKRAQIWFNTGYRSNPESITASDLVITTPGAEQLDLFGESNITEPIKNYRFFLFKDAEGKNLNLKSLATEYTEITDGGIIVRDDILEMINRDQGLPHKDRDGNNIAGFNKSFIVSKHPELGALLGKYAFHDAGPEMSKAMRDKGVHFMMPESAAKQWGERKFTEASYKDNVLNIAHSDRIYEMPVQDVFNIQSTKLDAHSIANQRLPKQVFSNLSPYGFKDIDPKVIEDFFGRVARDKFLGLEYEAQNPDHAEFNIKMRSLISNPSNAGLRLELLDNIEAIGVPHLLEGLKARGNEAFAVEAYKRIMRLNLNLVNEMVASGEMQKGEASEWESMMNDFTTITDRILRTNSESVAVIHHKFARPYVEKVLQNFVVNQLTRPKMMNSLAGAMRPYDLELQQRKHKYGDTSKLNTKDDIFFLDDSYKRMKITSRLFGGKSKTLGEFWKEYVDGKWDANKAEAEEIFRTLSLRVPMDSMSGAHALNFRGFTGRTGFGVLLHPRAMRALGGADLDGDKVHIFFGDEEYGFKKSWKDMYHSQKDEFLNKDGTVESPKSAEMRKLFVNEEPLPNGLDPAEAARSKFLQYSPAERMTISNAASQGRSMMGSSVVGKSVLSGAYAALRQSKDGFIDVPFDQWRHAVYAPKVVDKKGRTQYPWDKYNYVMRIEAKTESGALQEMNKRARAAIGFSSDPMDESGLKTRSEFFTAISDAGFNFKVGIMKKGKFVEVTKEPMRPGEEYAKDWELNEYARRKGLVEIFSGINTALYGRNIAEGRKWSRAEVKYKLELINKLPEGARNTFLPKVAEYLKDIDWHDNIFNRLDRVRLEELYESYDALRDMQPQLKELFDRPEGVPVRLGQYIKRVMNPEFGVLTDVGQEDLVFLRSRDSKEKITKLFKGLRKYEQRIANFERQYLTEAQERAKKPRFSNSERWLLNGDRKAEEFRRRLILDLTEKAQDFITQDLTDMVSAQLVHDAYIKSGLSIKDFKELIKQVEVIKKESRMMQRRFNERDRRQHHEDEAEATERFQAEMEDIIFENEPVTRAADQAETDAKIMDLKNGRTPEVERVIDHLLMNSIYRGRLELIEEQVAKLEADYHNYTNLEDYKTNMRYLENLRGRANGTGIAKVGLASKAVSSVSVKEHIDLFSKLFDSTLNIPADSEQRRVKGEVEEADKPQIIFDKDGNKVKASWFETGKDKDLDKYLDELAPFEGIHKGELTPVTREIYNKLANHLDFYHNIVGTKLNGLVRDLIGKDLNAMNLEDFKALNNWFDSVRHGTWYQRLFNVVKGKVPRLNKLHYMMFPERINEDLMRTEINLMEKRGLFLDRMGNSITGKVYEPTHVIGEAQNWIHAAQELSTRASEEEKGKLAEELLPFVDAIQDGPALHELAIRLRERGIIKHLSEQYKGQAVLSHFIGVYKEAWRKARDKHDYNTLRKKKYLVDLGGEKGKQEMTGDEVINSINKVYTGWNKKVMKWMQGDKHFVTEFIRKFETNGRMLKQGQQKMVDEFVGMMKEHYREGKWAGVMEQFGIDGMRRIAQQFMLAQIPTRQEYLSVRKRVHQMEIEETVGMGADYYFPHLMFDRAISKKAMERAMEVIMSDPNRSTADRDKDLKKVLFHTKQLTGDFLPTDDITTRWDILDNVAREIAAGKKASSQKIKWFDANRRVGNQFSRANHVAGWNVNPEAYQNYQKSVIDNFYKHISQIMTRDVIHRWDKNFWMQNKGDKDALRMKDNWVRFFKLYAQQAMGNPSQIPDAYLNNPEMNIKGTPYAWWADSNVQKKVNSIAKKLGLKKSQLPAPIAELGGFDYQDIVRWGNLEAKYELATLLAHPKSAVANLYGGTIHTWMNVGGTHLKNARDINFLKTNVNREWKSLEDVYKWVQGLGVVEEFLIYEADINPKFKNRRWKDFMKDATAKIRKDPDMEDATLRSLAKTHGITDALFNSAAWFMRRPERTLRRDAFMSHYLQAREKFGGAVKQFDHPFLVEMAKKGVKATQFLYSAPFRPMFAGTSLGKVMTRFQLWSWNSVKFRSETIKNAARFGWKPGTKEFERFQRMATADLFMLGMANLFMYSLFENALPAPWNWFQDTSEMLLGDDKERERAFFGAYPAPFQPLQMVTPPLARALPALFKGMVTDDYSRLSDYYIWTYFPFGRMARDIFGDGGVMENPARSVEKLTGLPYMQFAKQVASRRDEEMQGPRGLL